MITYLNRASISVLLLLISGFANSHSALFPDNFEYDNSEEGDKPGKPEALAEVVCENGIAAGYPCNNVNFLALVERSNLGRGGNLNDIWGWTDPASLRRFAIVGQVDGTSFVEVTNGDSPIYLGFLRAHNNGSGSWRDIKVYRDHAFIVGDGSGNSSHGLQIFNLRQLLNVSNPQNFSETAHLDSFGRSHNIVINEDSGFAYAVGSNVCSGGLVVVDISNPTSPRDVGCFSSDGYTHDAQCVNYNGPDNSHRGKEICVAYNEDTLTIVDVSNKTNPIQLSRTPYSGSNYTHQGWFLDDNHDIIIMNDELDEQNRGHNTKTRIFDVSNLDSPQLLGEYLGPTGAIDHNLYTLNGLIYESNYRAGLRILSSENIRSGLLEEVAFFDTIPGSNSAQFSGLWSNYIFPDGMVITSDIGTGLFVLRPTISASSPPSPTPTQRPTATPEPIPTPTNTPTPAPIACADDAINLSSTEDYSSSSEGEIFVDANGCTAYLSGNVWKITTSGFTITENSVVEFEFATNGTGEIQGIGFDEDTEASSDRIFQLAGSQDWGILDFRYSGNGEFQSFSIPVGNFYTGSSLGFVLANDKDTGVADNNIAVSNIVVRELTVPTPRPTPSATPVNPTPTPPIDADWFFIVHKPTGSKMHSCTDVDRTPIATRPNINAGDCVQWRFIPNGDFFHIQNRKSEKYAKPDTSENGSPISVVPNTWTGNWTQWRFEETGDGHGFVINRATGKLIHRNAQANTLIRQQPSSWRGDFTRWQFEPVQ